MCQFVDDIYEVVRLIRQRNDFDIVVVLTIFKIKKRCGYRSYHIVLEYQCNGIEGEEKNPCGIRIRTHSDEFLGND